MSETKRIEISEETRRKLLDISNKFERLNTGSTADELWLGSDNSGGYSWEQLDLGVNKIGELVYCKQSGCSCYGPEQPTPDTTYPLAEDIELTQECYGYDDADLESVVEELVEQTDTLYRVLNDESVTAEEVIALPNAEVRRAVVELIGYEKIVEGAKVLDKSETDGTLLRIPLEGDEDIVLVHVKDPSTTREYFLRVPPTMKTAREARAWTFGFEANDFQPVKES